MHSRRDASGVKYAELQVETKAPEDDPLTPGEIAQSAKFFKAIAGLQVFTNATADPARKLYLESALFCN